MNNGTVDLVKRLRAFDGNPDNMGEALNLMDLAADEIEQLCDVLQKQVTMVNEWAQGKRDADNAVLQVGLLAGIALKQRGLLDSTPMPNSHNRLYGNGPSVSAKLCQEEPEERGP
jgi:hypothetical protein